MKISITTNNKVVSVEDEYGFDCTDIHDAVQMFKGLLVCAGFHPSNVDDALNTEHTWFTEEERNENMQGHIKEKVEEWQDNLYKQDDKDNDYVF
jgi:hypothetical protein